MDELSTVTQLISSSLLLTDAEKEVIIKNLSKLNEDDLKEVKTSLEGEKQFIIESLAMFIEEELKKDPTSKVAKGLSEKLKAARRAILKANEADTRNIEQEKLDQLDQSLT